MSPKLRTINGKEYLVSDDGKKAEEVKEEEVKEEEVEEDKEEDKEEEKEEVKEEDKEENKEEDEEEEEEEEEEDEKLDEAADGAASKILASLGIDKMHDTMKRVDKALDAQEKGASKKGGLLNLAKLMKKDISKLTKREKVIGFFQAMLQRDEVALKALSEGVAADGGNLFPDEFRDEVLRDIEDQPRMRNEVTVIPMKRDVMNIPTLAQGPQVTWTAENVEKSTTTAHFGQATLTVRKLAAIMYISDELIDDSDQIDVVDLIIGLFSEAIGNEEDKVITNGNGTTQPTGLAVAAGIGAVVATGNPSLDDLINLEFLLPAKYHPNAKFLVHRNNIRNLRLIKDTTNRFIWQDPVAPTQPATFHGFPIIENNWLPESQILFGDFKKAYWLGDRQKMTVKISQDTTQAFTFDQTAVRVVSRIAGNVVIPQAFKKLTGV